MHMEIYDTDHGYWKVMVRENVPCVFNSCKLLTMKPSVKSSLFYCNCNRMAGNNNSCIDMYSCLKLLSNRPEAVFKQQNP